MPFRKRKTELFVMPDTLLPSGYEESGKAYDEVFRPKNGVDVYPVNDRVCPVFNSRNVLKVEFIENPFRNRTGEDLLYPMLLPPGQA